MRLWSRLSRDVKKQNQVTSASRRLTNEPRDRVDQIADVVEQGFTAASYETP